MKFRNVIASRRFGAPIQFWLRNFVMIRESKSWQEIADMIVENVKDSPEWEVDVTLKMEISKYGADNPNFCLEVRGVDEQKSERIARYVAKALREAMEKYKIIPLTIH